LPARELVAHLITLAFGVAFIAMGMFGYFHMGRFLDIAREVTAVVVEIAHESATPKGRIHPVLRFSTADGRTIQHRVEQHHNVQPADTLQVIYDPRDPTRVEVTTLARAHSRRWLFTALSIAVGIVVCLLPFSEHIKAWRCSSFRTGHRQK
jgi:hypothetical protein